MKVLYYISTKIQKKNQFQNIRDENQLAKQLKLFESVSSANKSSKSTSVPKTPATPNKLKRPKSDRIRELQALVEYHQHLYYNSQPEISDEDFDKLWDELKKLDPNNEVFSKVGAFFYCVIKYFIFKLFLLILN